jgi:hypothetical protein
MVWTQPRVWASTAPLVLFAVVRALNNGLGQTPAMGYSTWNDCSSFRDNGPGGWQVQVPITESLRASRHLLYDVTGVGMQNNMSEMLPR